MRHALWLTIVAAMSSAACSAGLDSDADADADADTDVDGDSDADADADGEGDAGGDADSDADAGGAGDADAGPACVLLESGSWRGSGDAFPMAMNVTLTMNAESCSFTLEWPMSHGANADGGTLVGDRVTLFSEDSDYYASCDGIADSTRHVAGVCSDDGEPFDLTAR